MESIVHSVSDIDAGEKHWLESLLGRQLEDSQRVFIMVLTPGVVPDDAERDRAAKNMEKTFDRTDAYARQHAITSEEADAAVQEAMDQVRPAKN